MKEKTLQNNILYLLNPAKGRACSASAARRPLLCFLALLFIFMECISAFAAEPEDWNFTAADGRGALPNDPSPPAVFGSAQFLPALPKALEGTVRRVNAGEDKVAALTFDMCELATKTTGCDMETLAVLRKTGTPATLFMGGKWMRTHAERVMQIMGEPLFEIGSHAWTHGNFGIMSESAMREQIEWTQAVYAALREEFLRRAALQGGSIAAEPAPALALFRLPYGRCSDRALEILAGYGLHVIQWDVAAETGRNNAALSVAKAALRQIRPGSIVLMHANLVPRGTAKLAEHIIAGLRAQGFRLVKVSELLTMGEAERTRNGYFVRPGDNLSLDVRFGIDGTGRKR
ncbi:MAG: polysaccharide deacetylase family protein [Mailhella sp.]|nr:polysaccharide deacetylase family protein [Mailhella sp.]